MKPVRIVGGGLTGILAAFEAHRLGCRDITLHERFDALGGVSLPRRAHGLELRDGCVYFGPKGDPIRTLLEDHGLAFEDFDNAFASVSPGGAVTHDFGGPAFGGEDIRLTPRTIISLADRIACYPAQIADQLTRYCQWHLGTADLDQIHDSAAIPLAINRVYPSGVASDALAALKRGIPLYDNLYGLPRALWGHQRNVTASLPAGGFKALFEGCHRALIRLGVKVHDTSLVSPRQAMLEHQPGEVMVWAANPTPLFKPMGLPTPALLKKSFATYVFQVRYAGPLPFYVQNFTATGAVFRLYLYESGGQTLMTAECVQECDEPALRQEILRLMDGMAGDLSLRERVAMNVAPRWIYHSTESIDALATLRDAFAARFGPEFVAGAWEPYAKGEKFAELSVALAASLDRADRAVTAA